MDLTAILFSFMSMVIHCKCQSPASWEDVWSYNDKLEGPSHWGNLHSAWNLCKDGRRQSPINIIPSNLLFDPTLPRLELKTPLNISGNYTNDGKGIVFTPNASEPVHIYSGPLSYTYQLYEIRLHSSMKNEKGSEHQINGLHFQGELHMTFFNKDIYQNFEEARDSPNGIAIIGIFIQLNTTTSQELQKLVAPAVTTRLVYKSSQVHLRNISIWNLIPSTMEYLTYEGSISIPPCVESVTWIIMNRALYISENHLGGLRELLRTRDRHNPPKRLFGNMRPVQQVNNRTIRTNIDHSYDITKKCNRTKREYVYTVGRFDHVT